MVYVFYGLSVMLMLVMPLALATWLSRRFRVGWGLFGVGAATFVSSQILHIPFNWIAARSGWIPASTATWSGLLLAAAFYGLSAGAFEETARYVAYRIWANNARSWRDAMMMGAGHGGIESILLSFFLLIQVAFMAGIRAGRFLDLIPGEQAAIVQLQAAQLGETPALLAVVPAVERAFTLILHLALSLLVMQVFVRGEKRWLGMAIGWHGFANALVLVVASRVTIYAAEGALAVIALLSLWLIVSLHHGSTPEPPPTRLETLAVQPLQRKDVVIDVEKLDESRYF